MKFWLLTVFFVLDILFINSQAIGQQGSASRFSFNSESAKGGRESLLEQRTNQLLIEK